MASEIDHEAAIRHRMLTNFTPIKPVTDPASRELTEQVIIKNSSAEGFAYVLLKQWRGDSTSNPQRETWGVVQTPVEVGLVYKDLSEGHISDGSDPAAGQLATGVTGGTEKGKLSITTFGELAVALLRTLRGSVPFPEDVSIVMNFGYGLVTFDMAFVSTSLVRLMKNSVAAGNNTLAVCTVSNNSRSFFGRGWPPRAIHEIDNEENSMDRYEWRSAPAGAQEGAEDTGGALDLFRGACQQEGHEKRVVLFMSLWRRYAGDLDPRKYFRVQRISAPAVVHTHKYELSDHTTGTNIAIDSGVTYVGPFKNVGRVLVPWHTPGFEFDSRSSQVVMNQSCRRSKSEIEYASRIRGEGGHSPQVHCDMTLSEFRSAPQVPTTSPAHTQDLARLLLIYIHTWAGSDLPLADIPATLPADEYTVEEQVRRLMLKGLVEVQAPPSNPFAAVGRRRLHSVLKLTGVGSTTTELLMTMSIESVHVAHFLAQLLGGHTAASEAAKAAVFNIATVLETAGGLTKLASIVNTSGATQKIIEDYKSATGAEKGAAANLGHGPLWLSLTLWYEMRVDKNYRAEESAYQHADGPAPQVDLLACVGKVDQLIINSMRSFEWDHTLAKVREILTGSQEDEYLFEDELSREDLLSIEQALVRAYLDKLVYIPLSHGIGNETPFAYDLTSNRPIQSPGGSQKYQLDEEHCRNADRLPDGRPPPGIFCFYTYLEMWEDESGQPRWSGQDMTHVSWEAVWRVLKDSKDCYEGQDLLHKIQTDQFLTR